MNEFETTFRLLRQILLVQAPRLVTVRDQPGSYYLDTAHVMTNGKPLFFGSVGIGKRYVSYHLMPIYLWPDLLDGISAQLRQRMQGKSCFNFKTPEPELLEELAELTRRGIERYRESGFIP